MSALLAALIHNDAVMHGLAQLSEDMLRNVGTMAARAAAFTITKAGANPPTFDQIRALTSQRT